MIGISDIRRFKFQLLLDAGKPGSDERRKSEIGIEIGAADATLDADGFAASPAEAEAGGAIVQRPDRLGRREGADLEAFVGIDIGREEPGDLPRMGELPGHVVAHQGRHAVLAFAIEEERGLAGSVPQRGVDMAR